MRSLRYVLLTVLFLILPRLAAAQEIKVLLLPFEVFSPTGIPGERRVIMDRVASSLEDNGAGITGIEEVKELVTKEGKRTFTEQDAFALAEKVKADFAVLGSITRLGEAFDLSWRIVDLKEKKAVVFYTKASPSLSDLLGKIDESGAVMAGKMASTLRARPAVKTGVIDRIIITGNVRVDTEAIRKKITSREGEPYSPDDVKEDVRAIYGTGFFNDITADLSDTASGKILTFIVKEMPFIKKIVIKGNKEVKEERIKEAITLKENMVLDRVVLGANAEKIKGIYAEEGYYLTVVKPVIETDGVDATVNFQIEEGPEVKVKRITFIGNRFFSESKLKSFMNTDEVGFFTALSKSGKFNEFIFQNDLAIIMSKYLDNGFINADILDQRVLLSEDKKWFYITIALTEGEQYRIGKIDATGDILPEVPKEDLVKKIKLSPGDIFNRTRLSKGIESVTDVYGDRGYAYADVKPLTKVDNVNKTIDITVDVKKNDLVYVEKVDITGNVRTRDKVIRREVELGEGDLFSSSSMRRSRSNLRRLGYFEDVKIAQTQGSTSERINLNVDVKERPTGSISVGFGYSSVDKFIGTASVAQSNFMGTGIKLDVSGTVSASSSKYVLGITEPWLFDKPISAGFDIYKTDRDYPDFKLRKQGFDLRFGFPLWDRYTRGYVTYKNEEVRISDVADSASNFIKEQAGDSTESSVKLNVKRDTRDDAFFPTEGHVINLSTELAGGVLGGSSQYIKYEADAAKFFALPWETTLSLHGAAGYVQGYEGKKVPIYERYFLGGMNSIRGFSTRTISPRDPATGDRIGGTTMFYTNVEFIFPIVPEQHIKGLLFFDAGNAYDGDLTFDDVKRSAGVGVRWFSPLGPLRLELGFNLDPRGDEKGSQWDFAIGSAF